MSTILGVYRDLLEVVYYNIECDVASTSGVLTEAIRYHLRGMRQSKGFRPALVLALDGGFTGERYSRAAVVQLAHEATLVFDDILDRGVTRRGQQCVHSRYGRTIAGSVGLWLMAAAQSRCAEEGENTLIFAKALAMCSKEIAEAEALQWKLRTRARPIPLEQWQRIAWGDTGALFRLAVRLAEREPFGEIDNLTYLYHGLDDVHDILDIGTLGGGKSADVRDRIPTLLACFTSAISYEGLRSAVPLALDWLDKQFPKKLEEPKLAPFCEDLRVWWKDAKAKV